MGKGAYTRFSLAMEVIIDMLFCIIINICLLKIYELEIIFLLSFFLYGLLSSSNIRSGILVILVVGTRFPGI